MELFGLEIKKKKDLNIPKSVAMIDFVEETSTLCNNQLRGVQQNKSVEYNYETIEYYIMLALERGIEMGIEAERQAKIDKNINHDS